MFGHQNWQGIFWEILSGFSTIESFGKEPIGGKID
jgi:hypothetical protein